MKFIERQKLTRLEKSINRRLNETTATNADTDAQRQQLQEQLKSIALDQLYIAFYPPDLKYMSLFTNGMNRAVDDARGQKRRRDVWKRIREGLLLADDDDGDSDVWKEAKSWVNLEVAKRALMEMDEDTYPNAPGLAVATGGEKSVKTKKKVEKEVEKSKTDNRFVFSKEVDGMFAESTTGLDYEEKLTMDDDGSDDSSSSSDDSLDDADPLKGFDGKAGVKKDSSSSSSSEDEAKDPKSDKVTKQDSSSSSSDSDSSDSESETAPKKSNAPNIKSTNEDEKADNDSDEESEDDFFASEKISAAEAFKQAEKSQHSHRETNDHYYQNKKGDKSKGFSTQNQTKREFRNFQHRKKRSRLG